MSYPNNKLTFSTLRGANMARLPQFTNRQGQPAHKYGDGSDWSDAQWLQAVVGELGEYANLKKKIERGDHEGIPPSSLQRMLADELADVFIYLDILAFRLGIDVAEAITRKFNEVSRRVSSDVFIDGDEWHHKS